MVKVLVFDMGGVLLKGNLEAVVQRVSDRLEVKFTRSDLLNLGILNKFYNACDGFTSRM